MTTLHCPGCGKPADVQHQSGFGRIPDMTLCTCWEPDCPLKQTTLTDVDYLDFTQPVERRHRDLSAYALPVARFDPATGAILEAIR